MNTNELTILFKIATRQRPEQFKALVENIINNCVLKNYIILVSIDADDTTMFNFDINKFCSSKAASIQLTHGYSINKIDAINRDVNKFKQPWDILVNVSDDMEFTHRGFDLDIRKEFESGLDWFVHFPDNNRTDICTMSVMGRDYYNRTKEIYYSGYFSVCCDQDATEQAKSLGRYKYNPKQIVNHFHPGYKTAEWDELYSRNESPVFYEKDQETLKMRRFNNFK